MEGGAEKKRRESKKKKKDFECDGKAGGGHGRPVEVSASVMGLFSEFAFKGCSGGTGQASSFTRPSIKKVEREEEAQKKKRKRSPRLTAAQMRDVAYLRRRPNNRWIPPKSPHELLQENHYHDPWRVLVICILLNCTSGGQVRSLLVFINGNQHRKSIIPKKFLIAGQTNFK